jgi:hypothetical protein
MLTQDLGIIMEGVQDNLESMEEAMTLFIQFIEERHADDALRRVDEYTGLLLRISSGSWAFPEEFGVWRAERGL